MMQIFEVLKPYNYKEKLALLYNLLFGNLHSFGFVYVIELAKLLKAVPQEYLLTVNLTKDNFLLFEFTLEGKRIKAALRPRSSDFAVFKQVFIDHEYRGLLPVINNISKVKDRLTLLDVGANVGYTSIYINTFCNNLDILAVEPFPSNVKQILLNAELNNAKIKVFQGGLWSSNTNLSFDMGFLDSREWSISLKDDGRGTVNCKTLSTLKQDFKILDIDILKIDIEGGEKELFDDNQFVHELKNVQLLAVEIHQNVVSLNKIHAILKSTGFKIHHGGETTIAIR
jgi:FkbM family methyltransferase